MADSKSSPDHEFNRRLFKILGAIVAVSAILALLWAARRALALIYVSALVAASIAPLVGRIERVRLRGRRRQGVPRWLAILVIYLAFLAIVTVVGLLLVPPLIDQATALWAALPAQFDKGVDWLYRAGLIPQHITLRQAVQQQAPSSATPANAVNAVNVVIAAGSTVVGGAFGIVTVLILSFYFLVEASSLFDYVMNFAPVSRRPGIAKAAEEVVSKVSAWLQANLILGGVMGGLSAISLGLLGEPFFYVVALLSAIGELIPMLGPIIAGSVAVALALTKSTKLALIVGVLFIGLHELEANILVPKIMERRVGVSAVAVMVAVLVGFELAGIFGAVLAIPTAAIISVIVNEFSTPKAIVQ